MISIEETVILIISCVWALSEIVGSHIIPRLRSKGRVKEKSDSDRGSRIFIWLSIFVSITISFFFAMNDIAPIPYWFFYPGITLMLAGIALRQWAIWILGQFFSTTVRVDKGHRIIKDGPYSIIRHPAYTGSLLILLGLGLSMRTWGGTLIIVVLCGLFYYYRISVEENALKAEFGKEYVEYAKNTKRLIPYLL